MNAARKVFRISDIGCDATFGSGEPEFTTDLDTGNHREIGINMASREKGAKDRYLSCSRHRHRVGKVAVDTYQAMVLSEDDLLMQIVGRS
jgi:hypothetical protein